MGPLRLLIEDGKFVDPSGRQVILRGINVAGDAKYPSEPFDQPSQVVDDFFDGDNVSFHKRPFTKDDAHVHFARLRRYGYNTIRYIFTWEAIEAKGPGIYDEEWILHTIDVLRAAKSYGFFVYMDPHQDVVRLPEHQAVVEASGTTNTNTRSGHASAAVPVLPCGPSTSPASTLNPSPQPKPPSCKTPIRTPRTSPR